MKEPLALLINDIHVDKDNIPEFNKNWDEALEICKKEGIYDLVVGGDLWTSRAGQTLDTLMAVKKAILRATVDYKLELSIVEGNHDKCDQEQVEGYSHLFTEYPHVTVSDVFNIMSWGDDCHVLVPMSYFPEDGTFTNKLKMLENVLVDEDIELNRVTLYLHEGIAGGITGGYVAPTDLDPKIFEDFGSVLVGHYHNRIHIPDTNIWYIGSSRQNNFGEDANKGYTIFYEDGSTRFIQNEVNTRYLNIERNFDELDNIPQYTDPLYKVKLKVTCSETESKLIDKEKLKEKGINRIEVIIQKSKKTTTQSAISERYDAEGIRKEYVNFCDREKINSELGIEYLNKIG